MYPFNLIKRIRCVLFYMTKQELKKILNKYFKESTVDALLRGSRLPSMKRAIKLNLEHEIPLTAWIDMKLWLESRIEKKEEGDTSPTEKASN